MQRFADSSAQSGTDQDKLLDAWDRLLATLGSPALAGEGPRPERDIATIPVTVLAGFLGAGKTTLLTRILTENPGKVLAIVNDIASVNVDAELIRSVSADTIQLENGCACCVLGDNLDEILTEASSPADPPDAIILEASGISDPVSLAQTVANNTNTVLDGIVAVVDAQTIETLMSDPLTAPLLGRQFEAAHIVALTKTTPDEDVDALRAQIGSLAPGRAVVAVNNADGLAAVFLGATTRGARPDPYPRTHDYTAFASTIIDTDEPVDADRFFALLDRIPPSVYRIKGWLTVGQDHGVRRYLLQAAGPRWRVEIDTCGAPLEIVVIGNGADADYERFCLELTALT